MQALHTAYVHRFNAAHNVEGHLLERRYRATWSTKRATCARYCGTCR